MLTPLLASMLAPMLVSMLAPTLDPMFAPMLAPMLPRFLPSFNSLSPKPLAFNFLSLSIAKADIAEQVGTSER